MWWNKHLTYSLPFLPHPHIFRYLPSEWGDHHGHCLPWDVKKSSPSKTASLTCWWNEEILKFFRKIEISSLPMISGAFSSPLKQKMVINWAEMYAPAFLWLIWGVSAESEMVNFLTNEPLWAILILLCNHMDVQIPPVFYRTLSQPCLHTKQEL